MPVIDDDSIICVYNPCSDIKHFYYGYINRNSVSTLIPSILLLNGTQEYTKTQLDRDNLYAYISF